MQQADLLKTSSPSQASSNVQGEALADINVALLNQLATAIEQMDDTLYTRQIDDQTSPIGSHARHIIEFYQALTKVMQSGDLLSLSYDKRERNLMIETSRNAALDAIRSITKTVQEPFENHAMMVTSIINPDLDPVQMPTLLYRELFYVFDHCVHHMALIKMIARACDHTLPASFGIAQSTQAYLKAQKTAS